jgi:hypothetical protein
MHVRSVQHLFGGTRRCAHRSEPLMLLPTAALQTFASDGRDEESGNQPHPLGRCHVLVSHSAAVQRHHPCWYRGQRPGQDVLPAVHYVSQP